MTNEEKIQSLQKIIFDNLGNLIKGDYIIADAPYYHNIGDILIWEGTKDFLKTVAGNNLRTSSMTSFRFPNLNKETTILLMGGGNFGDLWREFQKFRLDVVKYYPNNRIIMLPQSVWYDNKDLIDEDSKIFGSHPDLFLCARDYVSFEFMKKNFPGCKILMVPDMAFFINKSTLDVYKRNLSSRNLYLKRMDKELVENTVIKESQLGEYEIHDWPTYENKSKSLWIEQRLLGLAYRTRNKKGIEKITSYIADTFAHLLVRKNLVKKGFNFLSPYSKIITTRLHAMIMGILLDKDVRYVDNNSGKLSAFAKTWLYDLDSVKPYRYE